MIAPAILTEAREIAAAKRALDARFDRLVALTRDDSPELFECPSDFAFSNSDATEHFIVYVTRVIA